MQPQVNSGRKGKKARQKERKQVSRSGRQYSVAIQQCLGCSFSCSTYVRSMTAAHLRCAAHFHPAAQGHLRDTVQASLSSELQPCHLPEGSLPTARGPQQQSIPEACTMPASCSARQEQQPEALPSGGGEALPALLQQSSLEQCQASSVEQGAPTSHVDLPCDAAAGSVSPAHAPACESAPGLPVPGGSECVVCWEAGADLVFQPCGHACACSGCAALFLTGCAPCPMCRMTVQSGIALNN